MTFGEHMRTWREERGVGLRRFAKVVGVSPTFVSKMERGRGPLPGEETIRNMSVFFGKDPDELFAMADKVASDVLAIIIKDRPMRTSCEHMRTSPKTSGRPWQLSPYRLLLILDKNVLCER